MSILSQPTTSIDSNVLLSHGHATHTRPFISSGEPWVSESLGTSSIADSSRNSKIRSTMLLFAFQSMFILICVSRLEIVEFPDSVRRSAPINLTVSLGRVGRENEEMLDMCRDAAVCTDVEACIFLNFVCV